MQVGIAAGQHIATVIARTALPIRHAPARRFDDGNQRLHVVRLEPRLDHDVDESHREQRIAIAIAAVTDQTCAVGDATIDRRLRGNIEVAGIGCRDDSVGDSRAPPRLIHAL